MNQCRTSRARPRRRRNGAAALTRLTGVGIALTAVIWWPMAVFAADPAVDMHDNAAVVFTVIVLLFGSMTAGLFFASPLRRPFSSTSHGESDTEAPETDSFGSEYEVQPASEPTPEQPLPVAPTAAQHTTVATPWSTARPQPDTNLEPGTPPAP